MKLGLEVLPYKFKDETNKVRRKAQRTGIWRGRKNALAKELGLEFGPTCIGLTNLKMKQIKIREEKPKKIGGGGGNGASQRLNRNFGFRIRISYLVYFKD